MRYCETIRRLGRRALTPRLIISVQAEVDWFALGYQVKDAERLHKGQQPSRRGEDY